MPVVLKFFLPAGRGDEAGDQCGEAGMLPVVVIQRDTAASNGVRAKDTRFSSDSFTNAGLGLAAFTG